MTTKEHLRVAGIVAGGMIVAITIVALVVGAKLRDRYSAGDVDQLGMLIVLDRYAR